jgi:hypothetical protein
MERFDTHHAFLIQDSKAAAEALYAELLKDKNIEASFIFERNLSIDTAREIKDIAAQTTYKSIRYIIVAAYAVGHEAQNALLKMLEELPATKKIVFFVESLDGLLPTFISRFSKEEKQADSESKKEVRASFSPGALLKDAEKICKDIKDEAETKSAATCFLDELIVHKKSDHETVKKLLYFRSCIGRPSASVKQLLESAIAIAS